MNSPFKNFRLSAIFVVLLALSACASEPQEFKTPTRTMEEFRPPGSGHPIDVYDPYERVNRGIYLFNAQFDRYVFLPLVNAYQFITPDFFEDRVTSFFSNLTELPTFVNASLQGNLPHMSRSSLRFFINSTVGLIGMIDIATELGYPQEREDFGQTLGVWGVGAGPYLVLPVLGPSSLRDTVGAVVDSIPASLAVPPEVSTDPTYAATYGLRPLDARKNTGFRYYMTGSPFEYEQVRLLYTKKRELDIARTDFIRQSQEAFEAQK